MDADLLQWDSKGTETVSTSRDMMANQTAPRTAWKPGQSGNPGGRPKVLAEVQELARQHTPTTIQALADIVADKRQAGAARVAAANVLLDRAWGKAPQAMDVQGKMTLEALVMAASTLADGLAIEADG